MSARRFLWRWSLRTLRHELRQHQVVIALIAAAVALSVGAVVGAFNLAAPPEHRFGTAKVRATIVGDSVGATESLQSQGHEFGAITSATLNVSGSQLKVQLRALDPDNQVTGPLLDLIDGRWPSAPGEIAVTNDAPIPMTDLGGSVELADSMVTIVGLVENPTDLDDEFVLAATTSNRVDGFGVPPAKQSTLFLVDAPPIDVTFPAGTGSIELESRAGNLDDRTQVAIAVNVLSAVAMFEVALLVGAGFAVLARRRARQYGLLAAAGGTPRQIRQAATASGTAVGIIGSGTGAVLGVMVALIAVPRMETTVGHRISFVVPWWTVLPTVAIAVVTAAAAAWWPSRGLSREPIVRTLASLRPRPSSTRGSLTLGLIGAVAGSIILGIGAVRLHATLMVIGIIAAMAGLLLLSPAFIRLIGRGSARLPLASRLAGRSLARQQGRSAAVVAALTLALGIPVGIAVVTASIDQHNRTKTANLADNTAIIWLPGAEQPEQLIPAGLDPAAASDALARIVAAAPEAQIAPIDIAIAPDAEVSQFTFDRIGPTLARSPVFGIQPASGGCLDVCEENTLGDRDEDGAEILVTFHDAWIATPDVVAILGIDQDGSVGHTDPTTTQAISRFDDAQLSTHRNQSQELASNVESSSSLPLFGSIAPTLILPEMVADNGWDSLTVGWLVMADAPLSLEAIEAMTDAAGSDVLLEFVQTPSPSTGIRVAGILSGIVVSLGILLSAVGLLASESADELRVLRAIGASPTTNRRISASTAAILAFTGAVTSIPIGYLALVVLMANPRGNFEFVAPWRSLLAVLIVVPLLSAFVGWLLVRPDRGVVGSQKRRLGFLVAAAVILGACGSPDRPAGSEEPFAATIGCDPKMDAALNAWADRGVGASVAVFGGERECVNAYGIADFSSGRENTVNTVFSIGSITKAVTAAAIYDLIDNGTLTLDDPAGQHVTGLSANVGALTIRDLLLHTSGLTGEHGADHRPQSEGEAIAAISDLVLSFEAGASYSYTNAGYTLLALIIEATAEEGYREYLAQHILVDRTGEPIGGFWDGEPAAEGPRAFGYQFDGTISAQQGQFTGPHWAMNGNGGIAMTATEMAEWTWALFNGQILSEEATELLTSTTTRLGQDDQAIELAGWGLLPTKLFGEPAYTTSGGGGSIGHLMNAAWLPETGRVVVIAENASDYDVPFFTGDIAPAILAATGIPTPPEIPAADPAVLRSLTGRYRVGADGRLDITERDGGLLVAATGMDAVRTILPVPPASLPLIELHEQHAVNFVAGATLEGQRFLAEVEAESGPRLSATVLGSGFEGELGTYVELEFEEIARLFVGGFNINGGTEYWGLDFWPVLWFTVQPDGAFEAYQRDEAQPVVRLQASPDGLTIVGQDGTIVLTKTA